jgi:integrase
MRSNKRSSRELPNGVSIRQTQNGHGGLFWRVRLGRKFTKAGIVTRNFKSFEEALSFVSGGPHDQADGIEGRRLKFGQSILELSQLELCEAREAIGALREAGIGSLSEAVKFFIKHNVPAARMPMAHAIKAFVGAKQAAGRVERHVDALRRRMLSLASSARVSLVADLSRSHVEKWLGELEVAPITKANALRDVRIFARFCRLRGWMPHDPLAGVERPRVIAAEAGIVTPSQGKSMLFAADPSILASLAIKLFAGLRSSEVRGLDWQDITCSHIIVRASNAKTRSRRAVDIADNLAQWLAPLRQPRGAVVRLTEELWHKRIRQAAEAVGMGRPPHNFARHSFGTYHYALHQDEAKTAAALGNTPALVHRHYRALATSVEAAEFFAILPPTAGQIIPITSAGS